MERLKDTDLDELEALEAAATKGPWQNTWDQSRIAGENRDDFVATAVSDVDHDFIIAARNALPLLIAEVRRLRMPADVRDTICEAMMIAETRTDPEDIQWDQHRAALAYLDAAVQP